MEETLKAKDHLNGFFTNIWERVTEPEFLYAAAMAAAFVASCAILISVAMLMVRILSVKRLQRYPSKNGNQIDVESLRVPTLEMPSPQVVTILHPVPKLAPQHINDEIAEAITAQILNRPQPNRA